MSSTCSEHILSAEGEGITKVSYCGEPAVEGMYHCQQHAAERLELVRRKQNEVMARLKSRSEQLLELGLQLDLLKEDQRQDRQSALNLRRQVADFLKAGVV